MKRILTLLLFTATAVALSAQPNVASLWKTMPDSLLPYLSTNNRLDMLDFMEAKMNAEVTNSLDHKSVMTFLSDDSLSVKMSESMTVDLFLVPTEEAYDSCHYMVCLKKNYLVNEEVVDQVPAFYTVDWKPLQGVAAFSVYRRSSLLKRDEDVFKKKAIFTH